MVEKLHSCRTAWIEIGYGAAVSNRRRKYVVSLRWILKLDVAGIGELRSANASTRANTPDIPVFII
jgi:hypothetical protein